ncbi:MAG: hypothetical protein EBS44_06865 [Betaproteobacteria bacterium]|nr:hypothetical protein [Betaproteobacteria bacterium]
MHLRVRKIAFLFLLASAFLASSSWADMALATSKNCMSCHHSDRKVVGPALKEIAKRYANVWFDRIRLCLGIRLQRRT